MGAGLGTFDYEESGTDTITISDTTSAYQLFGGYQFNEHLALEFGFGRTGSIKSTFSDLVPVLGPITLDVDATYDIYALKALGFIPLDKLSLFASAGYFSAGLGGTVNLQGVGEIGTLDGHDRGTLLTAGIQRDFGLDLKSLSIRGEYQWFDIGSDVDAWGLNISMLFRF